MRVDREFLIWLAGFMDGEGCFMFTQNTVRLSITNTNLDVLLTIRKTLGCGFIHTTAPQNEKCKPVYSFRVNGSAAIDLCRSLVPFLRVKQRQAIVLSSRRKRFEKSIGFTNIYAHWDSEKITNEIHAMNRRGCEV